MINKTINNILVTFFLSAGLATTGIAYADSISSNNNLRTLNLSLQNLSKTPAVLVKINANAQGKKYMKQNSLPKMLSGTQKAKFTYSVGRDQVLIYIYQYYNQNENKSYFLRFDSRTYNPVDGTNIFIDTCSAPGRTATLSQCTNGKTYINPKKDQTIPIAQ
jgi:hypothetical protein